MGWSSMHSETLDPENQKVRLLLSYINPGPSIFESLLRVQHTDHSIERRL